MLLKCCVTPPLPKCARPIAASFGIHLFIYVLATVNLSSFLPKTPKIAQANVKIKIISQPNKAHRKVHLPEKLAPSPKTSSQRQALNTKHIHKSLFSQTSVKKYLDSQPTAANQTVQRLPYTGDKMGALIAGATDYYAQFDLPLVLRRNVTNGQCHSLLNLKNDRMIIKSLSGDKILRAALFESLRAPKAYKHLREFFSHFGSTYVKITFSFSTDYNSRSQHEFVTTYKIYKNEIDIRMTRYTQHPKTVFSGIPIEDDHSKRAKQLDRLHLSRLIASPAYLRPIRNFLLRRS